MHSWKRWTKEKESTYKCVYSDLNAMRYTLYTIHYTQNTTVIHLPCELWIRNKLFVLFDTTSTLVVKFNLFVCVFMFARSLHCNGSFCGAMYTTKLAFDYLCAQFAFILTTWIRLQFIWQQMSPNHSNERARRKNRTQKKKPTQSFNFQFFCIVDRSPFLILAHSLRTNADRMVNAQLLRARIRILLS